MDETDLGTLSRQGDRWTLRFTRRLAHPREKVWRAVTEPEHLAVWYPQQIVGERRAGAPLRFVSSAGDAFDGQMLVFDPPSVMEFTWGPDLLRIELEADGAGTLLTLTDTFDDVGKAARDAAGWHECLDRLVSDLDGATPAAWGDRWREHFTVDRINGFLGHELKFDNQLLLSNYLRVGFDPDGSWRVFKLRPDFHPADKVAMEDDITASVVLPREALNDLDPEVPNPSVKLVANCERRLFQRPDDAIHRGFDQQQAVGERNERQQEQAGAHHGHAERHRQARAVSIDDLAR